MLEDLDDDAFLNKYFVISLEGICVYELITKFRANTVPYTLAQRIKAEDMYKEIAAQRDAMKPRAKAIQKRKSMEDRLKNAESFIEYSNRYIEQKLVTMH